MWGSAGSPARCLPLCTAPATTYLQPPHLPPQRAPATIPPPHAQHLPLHVFPCTQPPPLHDPPPPMHSLRRHTPRLQQALRALLATAGRAPSNAWLWGAFRPDQVDSVPACGTCGTAGRNHVQSQVLSCSRVPMGTVPAMARSAPKDPPLAAATSGKGCAPWGGGHVTGVPHPPTNPKHTLVPIFFCRQELPLPLTSYSLGNYTILFHYAQNYGGEQLHNSLECTKSMVLSFKTYMGRGGGGSILASFRVSTTISNFLFLTVSSVPVLVANYWVHTAPYFSTSKRAIAL